MNILRSKKYPPFIGTRKILIPEISKAFTGINEKSLVYELGSGDGRMTRALASAYPQASFVGIEFSFIPLFLSKIYSLRDPRKNYKFIRGNMYKRDLSKATHIYTYLYPEALNALLPKLQKELAPGTLFISLDFKFKNKEPVDVIDLRKLKSNLGKELIVYRF